MDPYEYNDDDIDEMATIHESSDEEGSLYDIEKERNAIETFVDSVFKETEQTVQSSPESEDVKEKNVEKIEEHFGQVDEPKKNNAVTESKPKKIKHPFPFRKIPLFDRL